VHETEKIGRVVFPTHQEAALPLHPGKEALDDPASLVATQPPSVLGLALDAVALVRSNHLHALLAQLRVQWVAVVGAIANQILGLASIM
jgi:hypothetical protein